MAQNLWIGLFGMTVNDHNTILPSCNYAYVNAIALATDEIDFISRVKAECNTLHFTVEESEDVGLLCDRENTHHLDNNLRKIANWAKKKRRSFFHYIPWFGRVGRKFGRTDD